MIKEIKVLEYKGFKGVILEMPRGGHLCGYVQIPKSHKGYGVDYNDRMWSDISCHGGLTYSGDLRVFGEWYIGFDCAHAGDKTNYSVDFGFKDSTDVYRDADFVETEIKCIIDQLTATKGR